MKTVGAFLLAFTLFALVAPDSPARAGQTLQTINIATSAAGQSGYVAALIENRSLDAKYGIKINNMMMDFTEAANAVKLGRAVASAMPARPGPAPHGRVAPPPRFDPPRGPPCLRTAAVRSLRHPAATPSLRTRNSRSASAR